MNQHEQLVGAVIGGILGALVGIGGVDWARTSGTPVEVQGLIFITPVALGILAGWSVACWWRRGTRYDPILHHHLRALVQRHGPLLWQQEQSGQELVRRALATMPQQADQLCQALAFGVVARLQELTDDPPSDLLRGQAGRLVLLAGLPRVDALWAVCTWSWALGQRPQLLKTVPRRASQKSRGQETLQEYLLSYLIDLLVVEMSFGIIVGLFAVMVGASFWNGFFGGMAVLGVPILLAIVIQVWIFVVRFLLFDWFLLLDRDVRRTEQLFGGSAFGTDAPRGKDVS